MSDEKSLLNRKDKIDKKISKVRGEIERLREEKASFQKEIDALTDDLGKRGLELSDLDEQMRDVDDAITELRFKD